MLKNEKIDATFNIEEEDLGNWVASLMDAFEKINMAVVEGCEEHNKVVAAGSLGKHLS